MAIDGHFAFNFGGAVDNRRPTPPKFASAGNIGLLALLRNNKPLKFFQ